MKSWFCAHAWEVKAKTFTAPREHEFQGSIKGGPELLPYLDRCANGSTRVLMACSKCGKTDLTVMVGREEASP